MASLYISSTYTDLQAHRKGVISALQQANHQVVAMEAYLASDERPLEKCLADVGAADIYVGLFAFRYGHVPPGRNDSITEAEYREATRLGKTRLIFLLDETADWKPGQMDTDRSRIDRLREILRHEHLVAFFVDVPHLVQQVLDAVKRLEIRHDDEGLRLLRAITPQQRINWDWLELVAALARLFPREADIETLVEEARQLATCAHPELNPRLWIVQREDFGSGLAARSLWTDVVEAAASKGAVACAAILHRALRNRQTGPEATVIGEYLNRAIGAPSVARDPTP